MNCEHRPWHGVCYECIELRQEIEEAYTEMGEMQASLNTARETIERLQEDNNDSMHDVHTLAMREVETIDALREGLKNPNLLRLVVQGIIFDYEGE